MSKNKGFFSKLKKSTIITMVSCISFVVMTFLALLFFTRFPVTPSEKFTAGLGRESVYRRNSADGLNMTATSTEVSQTATETSSQTTTQTTTARTDFVITITTGKGFRTSTDGHTLTVNADYEENDSLQDSEETSQETTTEDYESYDYNGNDYRSYDYDYGWDY